MHSRIFQDRFRRHYRLYSRSEVLPRGAFKPRVFRDPVLTEQFVRGLDVLADYWRHIVARYGQWNFNPNVTPESRVSQLLIDGQLQLYPLAHLDNSSDTTLSSLPIMLDGTGLKYQLLPASALLLNPHARQKTFSSWQEAEQFIAGFDLDDKTLDSLLQASDLSGLAVEKNLDKRSELLGQALLDGKLFVIEIQQGVITTKEGGNALPAQGPGNKPASLGPHVGESGKTIDVLPDVSAGDGTQVKMDGHKIYSSHHEPLSTNPNATYRFSDPSYRSTGGDVYFGENVATSYYEVRQSIAGKSLYVGEVEIDNVLDLTDPMVLEKMNIEPDKLTAKVDNPLQQKSVYGYTTEISNQAYDAGYSGIIYPSSRKPGSNAVVLFEGRYDTGSIKTIMDKPI